MELVITTKSNSTAVRGHFFKIYINIIMSVKGLAWVAEIRKNKENEKKPSAKVTLNQEMVSESQVRVITTMRR